MSKRYAIWDKVSPVITPSGAVFTAEQWVEQYPVAGIPDMVIICSAGKINGGIFDTLDSMKMRCEQMGHEFDESLTDQEILDAIESIEDTMNTPTDESSPQERIAAALEYQNVLNTPADTNLADPDLEV